MLTRTLLAMTGITLTPVLFAGVPQVPGQAQQGVALQAGHAALGHTAVVAVHRLDPDSTDRAASQLAEVLDAATTLAGVHHLFVVDDQSLLEVSGVRAADVPTSHGDGVVSVFLAPDGGVLFTARGDPANAEHAAHLRAEFTRTTRPAPVDHYNLPPGSGLALQGYDPVAYFTDHAPAQGKAAFESVYQGVTYRFATAEHRRLFDADPARYLPTYGGWCASAMGDGGRKVAIDPTNFKVKNGRLFLFYKSAFGDALKDWNKREKEWEPAADRNWTQISGETSRQR